MSSIDARLALGGLASLVLSAAFGCGNGPWHIPAAVYDEGIAAWSYVEPALAARRGAPLPAVRVADFASLPPDRRYHATLPVPALTVPLVGWAMPPFIRTRNALLLPTTFGHETAFLRRWEFERVLARELIRSGAFEAVVADPANARLELRGEVEFGQEHRAHGMGLGLLWWPLSAWVPATTQRDRCTSAFELVRPSDGRRLHAGRVEVRLEEHVRNRLGNEMLLTGFGARLLPRVIERIVSELAGVELAEP